MFNLVQIVILVVLPLLIFYKSGGWPENRIRWCMILLSLVWYFANAAIHETAHLVATYMVGGKIEGVRLIPHFWSGEFGNAFIRSSGVVTNYQIIVTSISPYFIDFMLLPVGYFWLKRNRASSAFLTGLVYTLFCLRPLFNITNNLIGGILFNSGDFYQLSHSAGRFAAYFCGFVFELAALWVSIRIIILYRGSITKTRRLGSAGSLGGQFNE